MAQNKYIFVWSNLNGQFTDAFSIASTLEEAKERIQEAYSEEIFYWGDVRKIRITDSLSYGQIGGHSKTRRLYKNK